MRSKQRHSYGSFKLAESFDRNMPVSRQSAAGACEAAAVGRTGHGGYEESEKVRHGDVSPWRIIVDVASSSRQTLL